MRKLQAVASISIVLLIIPGIDLAKSVPIAGSRCASLNQTVTSGGKSYKCLKVGKKLLWSTNLPKAPTPTPTPTPTVADQQAATTSTAFQPATVCELNSNQQTNPPFNLNFKRDGWGPTTGTQKIDVIFVSYSDVKINSDAINLYKNTIEPYAEKFYAASSYGKFSVNFFSSYKVYSIAKSSADYNLDSNSSMSEQELFTDAMNAAKDDYDFSQTEAIMLVMPDQTAMNMDFGPVYNFTASVGGGTIHYGVTAAVVNKDGKPFSLNPGYFVHEYGHTLGLTEPGLTPNTLEYAWDAMIWDDDYFPDFFTWEKFILGWITPDQVDCLSASSLQPVTTFISPDEVSSSDKKMVVIKLSDTQAIVVESRKQSILDALSPSQEGVLVYKLDLNKGFRAGMITLIYNNPQIMTGQWGSQLVGTLHEGDSVTSDGVEITVIQHTSNGDVISVKSSS